MREKLQLFALDIAKIGDSNILETLHIIAYNSVHAGHLGFHLLIDEDEEMENDRYSFPVEIVNVRKMMDVKEIINAGEIFNNEDYESDLDWPYKMIELNKSFPENLKIEFKHSCGNVQRLGWFPWDVCECRDCHKLIRHDQIEEVGGLYVFHD